VTPYFTPRRPDDGEPPWPAQGGADQVERAEARVQGSLGALHRRHDWAPEERWGERVQRCREGDEEHAQRGHDQPCAMRVVSLGAAPATLVTVSPHSAAMWDFIPSLGAELTEFVTAPPAKPGASQCGGLSPRSRAANRILMIGPSRNAACFSDLPIGVREASFFGAAWVPFRGLSAVLGAAICRSTPLYAGRLSVSH
jgi:hypothetical protein